MTKGWKNESMRHSLSAKGVKSRQKRTIQLPKPHSKYYEIARSIIDSEMDSASSNLQEHTDSMGWDYIYTTKAKKYIETNLAFTKEEVQALAQYLKDKNLKEEDYFYDDKARDYVVNLVAGEIIKQEKNYKKEFKKSPHREDEPKWGKVKK